MPRVALRPVREGRAVATADRRRGGALALGIVRPLARGPHTLVTVVKVGARSTQVRSRVVVRCAG